MRGYLGNVFQSKKELRFSFFFSFFFKGVFSHCPSVVKGLQTATKRLACWPLLPVTLSCKLSKDKLCAPLESRPTL